MHFNFDLDLADGHEGERQIHDLIEMLFKDRNKIEVKRDFAVSDTGNVAIEYKDRGKWSGISTTTADWWMFVLDGPRYQGSRVVWVRTEILKQLVKWFTHPSHNRKYYKSGGDNGAARMVVIPVQCLLMGVPPDQMFPISEREA